MCGRYALNTTAGELIEHFRLLSGPEFSVRYNIAPTSTIPVIRYKPDAGRVGQLVRWGLIPSWAKDASIGAKLNNARGETVHEKPSFRNSFAKHRCIIPASGFYEWQTVAGKKQPYYIYPTDPGALFAFAGLLAAWKSADGETIVSTCIITTACRSFFRLNSSMTGLDPANPGPREMIGPCDPALMAAYPVRPLRTDRPECVEPAD